MLRSSICGCLVAVAILVAGCVPARQHRHPGIDKERGPRRCPPPSYSVVDLTQLMHPNMPVWPGAVGFKSERVSDDEASDRLHKIEVGDSTGTHLEAPGDRVASKRGVDKIPVSELVVPAAIIDVRRKVEADPDYQLSANDVVDWEAAYGKLEIGVLVIANTGWHERFIDPPKYLNRDAEGVMHFPGFGSDAIALLIERDVLGIGIDTLSADRGSATEPSASHAMLAAGKVQLANLANLDALPATGATIIIGALPIADGSRAPARVIALVPLKDERADGDEETRP